MSNLLKNSLYALYANEHDILQMFDSIDWSHLNRKFSDELYQRMDKESVEICQHVLSSELINKYDIAVASATQAMTREITELLELVLLPSSGKGN